MTMRLPVMPHIDFSTKQMLPFIVQGEQGSGKATGKVQSSESFSQLLANLFVDIPNVGRSASKQSTPTEVVHTAPDSSSGIPLGEDQFEKIVYNSPPLPISQNKKSNVGQKETVANTGLAPLNLPLPSNDHNEQSTSESPKLATGDSKSSYNIGSEPIPTKMEQLLAQLLTTHQDSAGKSVTIMDQLTPVSGAPAISSDIMALLSKKSAESSAGKESLPQILYNSSNSSVNRSSANEVGTILTRSLASAPQPARWNPQTGSSEKVTSGVTLIPVVNPTQHRNVSDISLDQPSKDLAQGGASSIMTKSPFQNFADIKLEFSNGTSTREPKATSLIQAAPNESKGTDKPGTGKDNQVAARDGNVSAITDKMSSKTFSSSGKQNSDNPSSSQPKHDGTGVLPGTTLGSKFDLQFKQEFYNAVKNNDDGSSLKPNLPEVAQTIVREAKLMIQDNKTVVNVKLEPESLGSVTLRVSSDSGRISADFTVKNADAHQYLQSSIPEMKQMLQSNGISLSHLSVSLSSGESQTKRQQDQAKKSGPKFSLDVDSDEAARTFGYNTIEIKI